MIPWPMIPVSAANKDTLPFTFRNLHSEETYEEQILQTKTRITKDKKACRTQHKMHPELNKIYKLYCTTLSPSATSKKPQKQKQIQNTLDHQKLETDT